MNRARCEKDLVEEAVRGEGGVAGSPEWKRLAFARLLASNGIELDSTAAGIEELEAWLRREIEPDPRDRSRPAPIWLSV